MTSVLCFRTRHSLELKATGQMTKRILRGQRVSLGSVAAQPGNRLRLSLPGDKTKLN